jgi:CDP-diacylglycerol--glycerol-3-phosphate 3-phosphatidyltransferase
VLLCGTFIFLLPLGQQQGWLTSWMVVIVVVRELAITGLRGYLESLGAQFGADWLGKAKMVLQCAAVIAIFVALRSVGTVDSALQWWLDRSRDGLLYAMLAATLLSGMQYLWRAVILLRSDG